MRSRTIFSGPWHTPLGAMIALIGLVILWLGLFGPYGLLRRRITPLARLEGWRLSVFGLAVVGLGAAWLLGIAPLSRPLARHRLHGDAGGDESHRRHEV